jgi:hypothetical protein
MASDDLHLARAGQEYGTCAATELAARVSAGQVLPTDHYWRPGMKDWALVSSLLAPRPPLPFARPADKEANFLDDLFSRESKVKGLQLLWDKLAVAPRECLVTESDHVAIATQVGYDVRKRCQDELKQWYRQALAAYLADRLFTPGEKANLENLARSFGFDSVTTLSLHRAEFESYYSVGVRTCLLRSGTLDEKSRQLDLLALEVPLPHSILDEVCCKAIASYMDGLFKEAVSKEDDQDVLDPVKADELRTIASAYGMTIAKNYADLAQRMDRATRLWQLYKAPLTPIASDRELGAEPCYWEQQVEVYQNKRVTVRRNFGGFSSSIKIFGSLRYRVGSYDVQRETEDQIVQVDAGRLLFLAQRVVFDGQLKNFNFKYSKVMDITAYSDAVAISRDTGPDLYFKFPTGQAEAAVILRRLVRQAKG